MIKLRTTLKRGIVLPSLAFIIGIFMLSALFAMATEQSLDGVGNFIFVNFNWVYVWSVTLIVLFLMYIVTSSYDNIRLGANDSKPSYSFFSLISMLFAAGMGIGLMYFSVAEPVQHYSEDIFSALPAVKRAQNAQLYTFFYLILPTLFNFIWMTVFENSAIYFDMTVAKGYLSEMAGNPDGLMFRFLNYLPFTQVLSYVLIAIIVIFFVTSADSGIFVMNSIATKNAKISPKWQTIGWGVLLAVLALMLLNPGGPAALQSMTLITALPFSIIMLLFLVSLTRALMINKEYYEKEFSGTTVPWSGDQWKQRLQQMLSFNDAPSTENFINTTVHQAFTELVSEFEANGISATINQNNLSESIEIEIRYDVINNFIYGVKKESKTLAEDLLQEDNWPSEDQQEVLYPKSYFGNSREDYDVKLFTKNELISDVLKHYERFINIISEDRNAMFVSSDSNHRFK